MFDLGQSTGHDAFVKISDLMRTHGYGILNHNAQYTWFTFVNQANGILAEVQIKDHNDVRVKLYFMYRHLILIQTPNVQIDHPKFKDWFEARILEVMGLLGV